MNLLTGVECVEDLILECNSDGIDMIKDECMLSTRMDTSRLEILEAAVLDGMCTVDNWTTLYADILTGALPMTNTLDCLYDFA